jgi:hypothetical protein
MIGNETTTWFRMIKERDAAPYGHMRIRAYDETRTPCRALGGWSLSLVQDFATRRSRAGERNSVDFPTGRDLSSTRTLINPRLTLLTAVFVPNAR